MTATAHALVGGAVAASIHNPTIGISIAILSHPILDMVPHWDFGWGWRKKNKTTLLLESLLDLSVGLLVAYLLFGQFVPNYWYFFGCVLGAELWDILQVPYWLFHWNFAPFSWLYKAQHEVQGRTKTVLGGIFNQVITIAAIIFFLQIVAAR
jgi:hypothetical protein